MSNEGSQAANEGRCSHCGQPIAAGAHFCANCGQPVAPPTEMEAPAPTVLDKPEDSEWLLSMLSGPQQGTAYPIGQRLLIGRDPACDVVLEDSKVSRRHAAVERVAPGRYAVVDLESSNGTFLQEERVERAELVPGALLRVGGTTMTLVAEIEGCASCGQPLQEGVEFCGHCGHPVGEPAEFDLDQRITELESQAEPEADQVGGVYRPAEPAVEPTPTPAAPPSEPAAPVIPPEGRRSSRRWLGIGCLVISLLIAAAVCCSLAYPYLEDLF